MLEFVPFPKIPRLSREIVITEKIDGTNASVFIPPPEEAGNFARKVMAASRSRWIEPGNDNFGFAGWVEKNYSELLKLGPGHHFGEWWGKGIQRNYSLTEKKFSLFNTARWSDDTIRPRCCSVVPVLYAGPMEDHGVMKGVQQALRKLSSEGSQASPGFMDPEGIVIFHEASHCLFKKTLKDDEKGKETL